MKQKPISEKIFAKATSFSVFQKASSAVLKALPKLAVRLNPGMQTKRDLVCYQFPALTGIFGWEGDKNAAIAYADGSYLLRSRNRLFVQFGLANPDEKIKWFNKEGYLPCLVSIIKKNDVTYVIENFSDCLKIDNRFFVVAYTRMRMTNNSPKTQEVPAVHNRLVLLDGSRETQLAPGDTIVRDYAVFSDKFGCKYPFPPDDILKSCGTLDAHYKHMKQYWNKRLSAIASPDVLPDPELINAYKAGYIYTMIVKDAYRLHVGENGYKRVFDHDVIGILCALLTMGDFRHFRKYASYILEHVQYPDARWKYSWVFALYYLKTGDTETLKSQFRTIRRNVHHIEADRETPDGILACTSAIDSNGHWTADTQSALTGLICYAYICRVLGEETERRWADEQYDSLLKSADAVLQATMKSNNLTYIPIEMTKPNEQTDRRDPCDANWASMFLFGRWSWDGYLFGAPQYGVMLDCIDATYKAGIARRKAISASPYNFGGYPHGTYCSSYNAGYGSAALRGEQYRDMGIRAYQFMIRHAMSGPFCWWEGIGAPDSRSPWNASSCVSGGGSCPHMWGQATASKVLLDALISEKADGTIIIGRGVPDEWFGSGQKIQVSNFPVHPLKRIGFSLHVQHSVLTLELTGDPIDREIRVEPMFLKNKIARVSGGTADIQNGIVSFNGSNRKITVTLIK